MCSLDFGEIACNKYPVLLLLLCDRKMNVKIREGVQNSGKTVIDIQGRDMGVEEGTGKEIGGRRNENGTMDVWSYKAGQNNI